jgi:hypothetical protein
MKAGEWNELGIPGKSGKAWKSEKSSILGDIWQDDMVEVARRSVNSGGSLYFSTTKNHTRIESGEMQQQKSMARDIDTIRDGR